MAWSRTGDPPTWCCVPASFRARCSRANSIAVDGDHADATVPGCVTYTHLRIGINTDGAVRDLAMSRRRRTGRFGWIPFAMIADAEAVYGNFALVSQGRVGWWYGTARWPAGESFRFTIDDVRPL